MDAIVQLISNVGFPIACCIVMFMQQNKLSGTLADLSNTLVSMNERLKDIENSIGGKRNDSNN